MMNRLVWLLSLFLTLNVAYALPTPFVYLRDVDPSILQDMRYASFHNFVGRPIHGYEAKECILTKEAALALAKVQKELKASALTLKVYDCYRPTVAVDDFIAWSKQPAQQQMKEEFYQRVNKVDFFQLGYVAKKSGHSRGSTIDLTIVPISAKPQARYQRGQHLIACTAAYTKRFRDNSIDMGTGYDCMDELSHAQNRAISATAFSNRMQLRTAMMKYGFVPYEAEWWHFTLKNEPFANQYFNFPVK